MTIPATYRDGAFHPDAPVDLPDGTHVEIPVEATAAYGSLHALIDGDADGPPDWSENVNAYLTGDKSRADASEGDGHRG